MTKETYQQNDKHQNNMSQTIKMNTEKWNEKDITAEKPIKMSVNNVIYLPSNQLDVVMGNSSLF